MRIAPSSPLLPILMLPVLLSGCDRPAPSSSRPVKPAAATSPAWQPLPAQPLKLQRRGHDCSGRCAEFEADWLVFPGAPALDAALLGAIEAPLPDPARPDVPAALRQLADTLIREATDYHEPWQQVLQLRQRPGLGRLVVLDLDNYLFTGGAHGTTTVAFVNWDRDAGRAIRLRDLLLPGREAAFWQAARRAHGRWLAAQEDAATLQSGWPFEQTGNVALTPDGLVLKYQPYSIGPYVMGTPELVVPLAELAGILRPEWLRAN